MSGRPLGRDPEFQDRGGTRTAVDPAAVGREAGAATAGWAVDAYVASSRDSWMTVAGDVRPSGVVVTSMLSHGSSGQPASTE